jgi:hypothetical protein
MAGEMGDEAILYIEVWFFPWISIQDADAIDYQRYITGKPGKRQAKLSLIKNISVLQIFLDGKKGHAIACPNSDFF